MRRTTARSGRERPATMGTLLGAFMVLWACQGEGAENDWRSMFNGRDLSGWVNVNCARGTWTWTNGMVVSTGVPTGVLRTDRHYENFEIELEWRHMREKGNAGLFLWGDPLPAVGTPFTRGIEVQILDGRNTENYTSHGDVFAIQGARLTPDRPHPNGWMRCLPSERRANPSPEWNHYKVLASNGVVRLAVNGEWVSGAHDSLPRKGYICLESEGSECHFRNVRIRELGTTDPGAGEVAELAAGFESMYTGVDLSGWRQEPGHAGHWRASDWILDYDGKSEATDKHLWTEKEYGDFEMIVDWRLTARPERRRLPVILPDGSYDLDSEGNRKTVETDYAGDSGIYLRGSSKSQVNIWSWPIGSGEVYGYREDLAMPAKVRAGVTPKTRADNPPGRWNRFVIRMVGDRLTVDLNGQRVIEEAQLPGVAARGPIALQHHGDPVQFANLFIRELDEETGK